MKISKLNIKRVPTVDDGIVHEGIPYFAGIGSRGTPLNIGEVMIKISYYYCMKGYGLRSGGAEGADTFLKLEQILLELLIRQRVSSKFFFLEKVSSIIIQVSILKMKNYLAVKKKVTFYLKNWKCLLVYFIMVFSLWMKIQES